jgi:hypothetical protein
MRMFLIGFLLGALAIWFWENDTYMTLRSEILHKTNVDITYPYQNSCKMNDTIYNGKINIKNCSK